MITNAPSFRNLEGSGIQIGTAIPPYSIDYVGALDETGQEILYDGIALGGMTRHQMYISLARILTHGFRQNLIGTRIAGQRSIKGGHNEKTQAIVADADSDDLLLLFCTAGFCGGSS